MPSFGLGAKGFKRKKYNDIIESMNTRARNLFGEDVNVSPRSPLGLFFRVISWSVAILWQLAEKVYFSGYVDTAEGNQLDYVGKYIGIERRLAQLSEGELTITGDASTIVPQGFVVETNDGIQFQTIEEATIDGAGEVTVPIQAIVAGIESNVPANTITEITNPTEGIDEVTNTAPTTNGRNPELDQEFKERYAISVSRGGASTLDSIRASLLELDGVRASLVVENNTMITDADDRPPKSIECYVLGGNSEDVGKSILDTKAAGIESFGEETVTVNDDSGNPHDIKFTYADVVDIYSNISITKNDKYPTNGDDLVRTELIKFIGGLDEDSNVYTGLGMGQDVVYTRLIKVIYRIDGIDDVDLEIGVDGINYSVNNIVIAQAEVAEIDYTKVVVTSA
ncbi:conserved hypothetical protein [Alkaliphilus metalliredigens QYMF]|uniref:Baseplate protein J-like barrel domain-containing protein n=1 Tax=Alkaliphilus metalliredigens (strain QYMF) TaxID=293826 RepID=A6TKE6_ALKMQ|nr:baseplate J/gp47 family protein [Alkaliphilus metalliredigens]ABR46664.1 conserved hypothetical protein [Alkaliphilus metalliredigens QYMF]ABR48136.1 conserved hypothetical protein [Alkaliphilus metalliredigens QYMF]ABR50419.1 conserved hypothetical protein [Alkaliphilus metalliredigens QYMF]